MRIGTVAEQAGVSTKAIRYYESIGVLPEPERTASGYRDYSSETSEQLRFIRSAQAVGLTLGEIREILAYRNRGETPCAHVHELIRRRATQIDQEIAHLEAMRTELRRLERRARTLSPEDCSPHDVCHVIPRS
jgi:MerR family copper efflux transcriptional regulator